MIALWSTPTRKAITSITAIFALFAAAGGAVKAWPDLQPFRPAIVWDVNQKFAEYKPVVNELMRWRIEDLKAKNEAESAQWSIKLPSEQDQQTRSMIQDRLHKIEQENKRLDERLQTLQK